MYLARLSIGAKKSADFKRAVLTIVEEAIASFFNVPRSDVFLMAHGHAARDFNVHPNYAVEDAENLIFIQLTYPVSGNGDPLVSESARDQILSTIAKRLSGECTVDKRNLFFTSLQIPKNSFGPGVGIFSWTSFADRPIYKLRDEE